MRLWSLHPKYLDIRALTACWREGLLARKVLQGATVGYRNHPQLMRFRAQVDPVAALDAYLSGVYDEALRRGYNFDISKICYVYCYGAIMLTTGQLNYEQSHLLRKLQQRDIVRYKELERVVWIDPHPLFYLIEGDIEPWERV